MANRTRALRFLLTSGLALATLAVPPAAFACTRFVYIGAEDAVVTARSMDWKAEIGTNLYILPRGIARTGEAGENSIEWTAKYGSVVATGFDVSTTDGVNEQGLMANLLWLTESEYPAFDASSKPGLTIAAWAQYALDNFATVAEAVEVMGDPPFTIVTDSVPGEDRLTTLHLSLSDSTGDSAIFEYIDGRLVVHHGRQYQVMTNSPTYDEQLALAAYWSQIGGTVMLPGTNRASDRFARADFYIKAIPPAAPQKKTLASVFGIIRNVSVPLGISTPDQPEISSTRWRTVYDHKAQLYFFESAMTPNTFWVDLKAVDFAEGAEVKRLDLGPQQDHTFSGDATADFQPAAPFHFLGLHQGG
ncbi:linear amide C-N hydrolase [Aureimonas altamirensis]|uniref:linear amide C-N hydrolase n=1 Tax=Aureimonas altamirensis TaxID=370622 RepID=UPI003D818007